MIRTNAQYTITEKFFHIHESTNNAKQMFFYPEISGYGDYTGEYFCKRTFFLNYELMFIVKGNLELHTDKGVYRVGTNEACLFESKTPHYYFSCGKQPISIFWMHFHGAMMDSYFQYIWNRYHTQAFCVPKAFAFEYAALIQNLASDHPHSEMQISSCIMQLLSMLQAKEPQSIDRIEDVCHYIQANYTRNISLKEMAALTNLSVSHFCSVFKEYTGLSPHQYLIAFRLSIGYHLLFSSNDSIEEIAEEVGFSTPSSFIKAFSKKYNTTPARLRNTSKSKLK